MTPQSAKSKVHHGTDPRPLNKYKHSKTPHDYFEQRVIRSPGCWKFSNKGDRNGYPQIIGSIAHRELGISRAHVLSYYLYKGEIPKGMFVCHTCDNPWCVNPSHLFLETPNDNVQDMMRKGRYKHPGPINKISDEIRQEIMKYKGKLSCMKVGPMFGVSFSWVARLWKGTA